jgi:mono/diheme cytochrome c family protein
LPAGWRQKLEQELNSVRVHGVNTFVIKPVLLFLVLLLAIAFSAEGKLTPEQLQKLPAPASGSIDFTRDIKPIFESSCVKCHGRGKDKGGFRLDTRDSFLKGGESGVVATAGRSAESYIIELVSGLDPDNVMPVKGSKLTAKQVGLLRAWIDQGMSWDAGITFAKPPPVNLHPRRPELPPERRGWENPIDRFLEPYFARHRIKPARPVDDRTYARRIHLDVIGLLPTPAELEQFLGDKRADKRERLVARLLADNRRYAEHWLTFWNDLLRNDYKGTGYIDGGREQISSWLYAALYQNKPYNRFVAELINPTAKSAGFTKGIVWRGTVNASQIPPMQAAQNISQVFMGVNLKCASCHDSFINDWALADAYALANIYADEPLEMFQCDKPTGKKAGMGFIYPELGQISAKASKAERTQRLAEIITQPKNGRLTRTVVNRLWSKFLGYGLVEPIDDMEQRAWNQDLLDWLAEDLAANGYDLKRTTKLILTSRAYQLPAVSLNEQKQAGYVFAGPAVRRLTAEQFRDALGALTGVWYSEPSKGINLSVPGSPEAQSNALPASVKWIWSHADAASRANAGTIYLCKTLVLDVAPKEAWAVAACDNSYTLYVNGTKVVSGKDWNEPNLADLRTHLKKGTNVIAVAAVNHAPDNKPPAAGKPVSDVDANPAGFIFFTRIKAGERATELGSDRTWLWSGRGPDGWEKVGFATDEGQAAAELGGPAAAPWNAAPQLAAALAMNRAHTDVRASLVAADPLAVALGRPNREQVITTRASAATTLQALELTNGDTLSKVLKRGAEKVLAEKPGANHELVTRLYAKALGRKPTGAELKLADELLGKPAQPEAVEDLLWAMAVLPEFQLIY